MKKKSSTLEPQSTDASAAEFLRSKAEEKLKAQQKQAVQPLNQVDSLRLLHELQVHQIELEMQNEELLLARAEVETLLRQYTDLYDFAPVGYFTLASDGTILRVNLAGAGMLGLERSRLKNQRFRSFVDAEHLALFDAFLSKAFESRTKKCCEIVMHKQNHDSVWVRIEVTTENGQGDVCHTVVMDITERKAMDEIVHRLIDDLGNLAKKRTGQS